ncbi:MAG: hypothetical protein IJF06_00765 [Bacteroidaceae bacterium]|nr:hypothetical protein [Bacteroidaceae bacterium]
MKKFLLSILCLFCVAGISAQTNIASNPGFENWEGEVAVDWAGPIGHNATVSQSTDARTGNYSIAVAGNAKSNKRLASKSYTLAAGTYTFSVYVKANGTEAGQCRLGYVTVVDGKAGTYIYESAAASATTAEWTERVYEFTLAEETTIALIVMNNKNGGGTSFLVDDVTLTNGEATEGGNENEGEGEGEGEVTYLTIAEVVAAGAGEAATKGTVVATYARGFLMSDATGSILVYLGSDKGYAAGDAVTVSGTTNVYGGLLQFGNTAVVEKTGTATVEHPTATVMDGAAMDAYLAAPAIQYVEYTGTLTISDKGYYNVAVDGAATAVGSIQYPQDAIKANLTSGSVVKVTGYTIGTSSSKYVNTMAVKVETVDNGGEGEGEGEDEELEVTDISDIIAAGEGKAKAQGTIMATYARGFLLDDGTGSILVYLGSDGGNAVGEIVTVEGTTSMYGGLLQFAAGSVVTRLTTTTVSYPAATVMDGAAMDAYLAAPAIQYVEYTGTLTINGNYYNVAVDGAATAVGSIQYPQDAIKASLTSGSVVKVTGYTIGVSSSKYVNTMAVKVETVGEPEAPAETEEYTVTEALAAYVDGKQIPAIVTGYIVGAMNSTGYVPEFGTTTVATNIFISDDPDTDNETECLIVQLPSGDIRSALNLVDNPGNYKKQVRITGSIETYFKVAGLKSVTAFEFTGATGIEKVEIRNEKSEIYDLTGRRVENITAPGIYIVGGKKVLVK